MNKHVEVLREVRKDGGCVPDDDYVAAIDAAIAALEWQPIDTAPKDGTPVLVYDCWHQPRYSIGGIYKFTYATHWMPLPPPPTGAYE